MNFEPDKLGDNEEKCINFIIEFGNSETFIFFFSIFIAFLKRRDDDSRLHIVKQQKEVNDPIRCERRQNIYIKKVH